MSAMDGQDASAGDFRSFEAIPVPPARVGDPLTAVETPALLLDLDAFEANLAAVHEAAQAMGGRVRAHAKAHRCSEIALRQIAAGAIGVCCQKVSEAAVFVSAGVTDVLVSNVVVGEPKARRLAALAARARVGVCVDSALQVAQLAEAARQARTRLGVLIELDVGARRCGVADAAEALTLARQIADASPWLELRGLQAYHGPAQHLRDPQARAGAIAQAAERAAAVQASLRAEGFSCDEVCGGGTGSWLNEIASGCYTEIQPGSYVLMDADYGAIERDARMPALRQALHVWCTVITRRPGHAVLDAGLKAFAVDSGKPVPDFAGWSVRGLSDEHTVLEPLADAAAGAAQFEVGDKVRMVPGHCDPTVNLHDWIVGVRGNRVEAVWRIDARGFGF